MRPSYRAEQVGSFLRPPVLLEARAAHSAGKLGLEALREIEDAAILVTLELQRQVGLDVFTDGEYRRGIFLTVLTDAVDGFVPAPAPFVAATVPRKWRGPGETEVVTQRLVVGAKLRQVQRLADNQAAFLKQHSPGPFKITLPSPAQFVPASYQPGLTDRFYRSRSALLDELVGILRSEIKALVDEGVPYIQMDAPNTTYYVDSELREQMRQSGVDPDQALDEAISADNACFDGSRRDGVTLAIHLCRGNHRSHWLAEGSYEPIAEKLFGSLQVDRFLLEYDGERAGGFEPLRFVPKGKTVVLGLITTKIPKLESPDSLLRRIEEASRYVPIEYLAISPQCGFASSAEGNLLTADDQRRKLELVVEIAQKVWS